MDRTLYGPDVIRGGQQQNSVPDSATLTVLTRIIPELPPKELIARLEQLVADVNATDETMQLALHVSAYDDAVVTPKDSQLIQLIQRLVPDYLPEPLAAPAIAVSLGTDASQFIKANPNLELAVIGPGNATAHKADEYVERQAYLDMVGLYEAIAKQYLQ
ncbi:Acetylornithine deacetylase [Weissella sp. DD23]|nr:Acetylornithine deacetylase [Weissella sp. DD23]